MAFEVVSGRELTITINLIVSLLIRSYYWSGRKLFARTERKNDASDRPNISYGLRSVSNEANARSLDSQTPISGAYPVGAQLRTNRLPNRSLIECYLRS